MGRLHARADFRRAAELLSAAFERGHLSKLELMQLWIEHPELLYGVYTVKRP